MSELEGAIRDIHKYRIVTPSGAAAIAKLHNVAWDAYNCLNGNYGSLSPEEEKVRDALEDALGVSEGES